MADTVETPLMSDHERSAPSVRLIKRANGAAAHLLEIPATVPYKIELDEKQSVHVIPCLTPLAVQKLRADAELAARQRGGWAPRAVGCCTNDVLVSQLSAGSQQLVLEAFRRVIMPYAAKHFPDSQLCPDSLPRSASCFFIIKYSGDQVRSAMRLTLSVRQTIPHHCESASSLRALGPSRTLTVRHAR